VRIAASAIAGWKLNYYHSVLTPVVAQPGNEHVIALERNLLFPRMGRRNRIVRSRREALDREAWGISGQIGVTILG